MFIYLFLAMLGLHCCVQIFSSCSELKLLSSCAVWTSFCGGFSCCESWALGHSGFSSCGSQVLERRLSSCAWA